MGCPCISLGLFFAIPAVALLHPRLLALHEEKRVPLVHHSSIDVTNPFLSLYRERSKKLEYCHWRAFTGQTNMGILKE